MAYSIPSFTSPVYLPKSDYSDQQFIKDFDKYTLGKAFFDLKEFDRAAFFLEGCTSQKAYFLYMYSRYLVSNNSFDRNSIYCVVTVLFRLYNLFFLFISCIIQCMKKQIFKDRFHVNSKIPLHLF